MIRGTVTAQLEAVIEVSLRGPTGRILHVEAVVDTGFDGKLSLPAAVISQLGFPWVRRGEGILADGSECSLEIYEATVLWDGRALSVLVDQIDTGPMVGMALLEGYELKAEIRSGGKITIKRLPPRKRS
jgi:clan AA aspartic protease